MTRVAGIAAALLVTLVASRAAADDPYTHDGLHFRWGVGVAATGGYSADNKDEVLSFDTVGLLDGVQIGGYLAEDLSLFLEADFLTLFIDHRGVDPTMPLEMDADIDEQRYGLLVGPGVGRYIMPANIYVSASVGASLNDFGITDEGIEISRHDIGVGFSAMAGKEWWVHESTSIGVAGQFLFLTNLDGSRLGSATVAAGLLFVASH